MRLARVDHAHGVRHKLLFGLIRLVSGFPVPGVVKTLRYRAGFFGRWQGALTHQVMRGPSDLTVGERELIAAFVSRLGQCLF